MKKDIIIVGAGAAGIGMGVILQSIGIPYVILERDSVGSSFKKWPEGMRFITPSFTGNFFGMPDLNSITPDTSPAYSLKAEHPSGKEYAEYLELLAEHYDLSIKTGVDIKSIEKGVDTFKLDTGTDVYESHYVIWAAGEYQYPNIESFNGTELCLHNTEVKSWSALKGDSFPTITNFNE